MAALQNQLTSLHSKISEALPPTRKHAVWDEEAVIWRETCQGELYFLLVSASFPCHFGPDCSVPPGPLSIVNTEAILSLPHRVNSLPPERPEVAVSRCADLIFQMKG